MSEECIGCLSVLATEEIPSFAGADVKATVDLMFKIINNIVLNPMEMKYRKLSKTGKALNSKILCFPSAVRYLKLAGFKET